MLIIPCKLIEMGGGAETLRMEEMVIIMVTVTKEIIIVNAFQDYLS